MSTTSKIFNAFKRVIGNAMVMPYGASGSMKSKFCMFLAREVKAGGGNVFYIDTEGNLSVEDEEFLGPESFTFTPEIEEIHGWVKRLGQKGDLDLIILDSVGILTLGEWGELNARQKGDIKLKEAAILKDLQEWAYRKKAMAVVTTQVESEFVADDRAKKKPLPAGLKYPAVGKGGEYIPKEVWYFQITEKLPDVTASKIIAYRSRIVGTGKELAEIKIREYPLKDETGKVVEPAGFSIKSLPALQKFFTNGKGPEEKPVAPAPTKAKAPPKQAASPVAEFSDACEAAHARNYDRHAAAVKSHLYEMGNDYIPPEDDYAYGDYGPESDGEPAPELMEIAPDQQSQIYALAISLGLEDDPRYSRTSDLSYDEGVLLLERLKEEVAKAVAPPPENHQAGPPPAPQNQEQLALESQIPAGLL